MKINCGTVIDCTRVSVEVGRTMLSEWIMRNCTEMIWYVLYRLAIAVNKRIWRNECMHRVLRDNYWLVYFMIFVLLILLLIVFSKIFYSIGQVINLWICKMRESKQNQEKLYIKEILYTDSMRKWIRKHIMKNIGKSYWH